MGFDEAAANRALTKTGRARMWRPQSDQSQYGMMYHHVWYHIVQNDVVYIVPIQEKIMEYSGVNRM